MIRGAIVLCGGQSTRMGREKATLPFGPECMLQRVVRLLGEVITPSNLVVVASRGQLLPELPSDLIITRDRHEARGPLEGIAAGLRALPMSVEVVYATSCDVPLLVPAFVEFLFCELGEDSIAVPCDGNHSHPLAAVYRRSVLPAVEKLLAANRLRSRLLFDEVPTREIDVERLRAVDPHLRTLENLNRPEDYTSALKLAGFSSPE